MARIYTCNSNPGLITEPSRSPQSSAGGRSVRRSLCFSVVRAQEGPWAAVALSSLPFPCLSVRIDLSLLLNLCPGTEKLISASHPLPPYPLPCLRWQKMHRVSWSWVFPLLQIESQSRLKMGISLHSHERLEWTRVRYFLSLKSVRLW